MKIHGHSSLPVIHGTKLRNIHKDTFFQPATNHRMAEEMNFVLNSETLTQDPLLQFLRCCLLTHGSKPVILSEEMALAYHLLQTPIGSTPLINHLRRVFHIQESRTPPESLHSTPIRGPQHKEWMPLESYDSDGKLGVPINLTSFPPSAETLEPSLVSNGAKATIGKRRKKKKTKCKKKIEIEENQENRRLPFDTVSQSETRTADTEGKVQEQVHEAIKVLEVEGEILEEMEMHQNNHHLFMQNTKNNKNIQVESSNRNFELNQKVLQAKNHEMDAPSSPPWMLWKHLLTLDIFSLRFPLSSAAVTPTWFRQGMKTRSMKWSDRLSMELLEFECYLKEVLNVPVSLRSLAVDRLISSLNKATFIIPSPANDSTSTKKKAAKPNPRTSPNDEKKHVEKRESSSTSPFLQSNVSNSTATTLEASHVDSSILDMDPIPIVIDPLANQGASSSVSTTIETQPAEHIIEKQPTCKTEDNENATTVLPTAIPLRFTAYVRDTLDPPTLLRLQFSHRLPRQQRFLSQQHKHVQEMGGKMQILKWDSPTVHVAVVPNTSAPHPQQNVVDALAKLKPLVSICKPLATGDPHVRDTPPTYFQVSQDTVRPCLIYKDSATQCQVVLTCVWDPPPLFSKLEHTVLRFLLAVCAFHSYEITLSDLLLLFRHVVPNQDSSINPGQALLAFLWVYAWLVVDPLSCHSPHYFKEDSDSPAESNHSSGFRDLEDDDDGVIDSDDPLHQLHRYIASIVQSYRQRNTFPPLNDFRKLCQYLLHLLYAPNITTSLLEQILDFTYLPHRSAYSAFTLSKPMVTINPIAPVYEKRRP